MSSGAATTVALAPRRACSPPCCVLTVDCGRDVARQVDLRPAWQNTRAARCRLAAFTFALVTLHSFIAVRPVQSAPKKTDEAPIADDVRQERMSRDMRFGVSSPPAMSLQSLLHYPLRRTLFVVSALVIVEHFRLRTRYHLPSPEPARCRPQRLTQTAANADPALP